jgi:hypothetical protein
MYGFFICVPRFDSSYALEPKNSASDAMWLKTRHYSIENTLNVLIWMAKSKRFKEKRILERKLMPF